MVFSDLAGPGSRILLIGSAQHATGSLLPDLPSVTATLDDLAEVLIGRCDVPADQITTVADPANPIELANAIERTAEQADDVFLLYYAGHGVLNRDGALHLATQATVDLSRGRVWHQALAYTEVNELLRQYCRASRVVAILDACHTGRAFAPSAGSLYTAFDRAGQGSCLLAAASRDEWALAPAGARRTAFTGALIDLLSDGDPAAGPQLTLDTAVRCLTRLLSAQGLPTPRWWSVDQIGDLTLADNPAYQPPVQARPEAPEWDLYISYAAADKEWAEWIAWTLEDAGYRILVQAWDISPGAPLTSRIDQAISRSAGTLVILSSAYAESPFGEAEWQAAWRHDPTGTQRRIIPVRVDDSAPPRGLLSTLVYLDLQGLGEAAAKGRLVSNISLALRGGSRNNVHPEFPSLSPEPLPRGKPDTAPAFPTNRDSQVGRRTPNRLEDVFQPVGVPSVTFVAPKEYTPFRLALRQRGLCVVLEGPSGIGKTTLLDWAVSQDSARLGPITTYSARKIADIEAISRLPIDGHSGIIAIDDFHRLPDDLQDRLVDYLKRLADDPKPAGKLVVIGIPETAASLVSTSYDVANRIRVFRLGPATQAQIGELITKGEAALNISFANKKGIIHASAGSLITVQSLCSHLAALAGVEETASEPTEIQIDVYTARAQVADELRIKYRAAVLDFAAMDAPDEAACVDLLLDLGRTDDGVLDLDDTRMQSASFLTVLKKINSAGGEPPARSLLARHFFYDDRGKRIIADDPQLLFYLRQLKRDALVSAVGKRLPAPRNHAFVCYSHADARWQERLLTHLDPLEREGVLDIWSDKRIEIGDDWNAEIIKALGRASVAILLISADFLASEFVRRVELPALLAAAEENGCRVVPILVRASTFNQTPGLSNFQHANPNGKTLASLSEEDAEQVLANVARWLLSFIKKQGA